ncbi:hypothetical protein DV738_g3805, partial [Chaetothyriales sp. CBS 135597]
MRAAAVLGAVLALAQFTQAIFSDDAFHLDSHLALLGIPQPHTTFFHKPQSSSNASLLYTLSDRAFVGALNPKDGSVLWRQSLSQTGADPTIGPDAFLVAGERDGQVVSGFGNAINSWDALDGRLRWQYFTPSESQVLGLRTVPVKAEGSAAQDVVFLSGSASGDGVISITRLAGRDGAKIWDRTDSSIATGSRLFLAVSGQAVFVVARSNAAGKTKILELDLATGKEKGSHSPAVDSEILAVASSPTDSFVVTSEKPYKSIKVNVLGSSKVSAVSLDDKQGEAQSASVSFSGGLSTPAHLLIHLKSKDRQWAEVLHINPKNGNVVKAYTLPAHDGPSTFAAHHIGSEVFFVRTTDSETSLYASSSADRLETWPFNASETPAINAPGLHATAEVINTKSGFAVRVAETSDNGHFSLLRNGEPQWTRPEVLSHATLASWLDENPQSALVEELETEAAVSPLTAYVHRWSRHLNDLASLPHYIQRLPSTLASSAESAPKTRNRFVGQKVVVLATNRLDVLAVETDTLAILWHTSLVDLVNGGSPTITQLITANGRTTAYLSDGSSAVLNATNGQHIEYVAGSGVSVHKIAAIPASPHESIIIKIDVDGKPHIADDVTPLEDGIIVTISEAGTAFGWTLGREPRRAWTLKPQPGAAFTSAISRVEGEPVASIGTVLGNRAVLYKHISPNLALLTATSAHGITINLIDAITGSVLHSSSHSGVLAGSPVPAVFSEHWFALAFASQDPETSTLSTQLVISEIYESEASNDRGPLSSKLNYSSFSPDAGYKPYIISRAFSVAQPISQLAVTQTGQGITSRRLLAVLPESDAIAAIPREILNARRPVDRDPTRDEQEEGITKYVPILEIDPRWYLTHSREVTGIQKILATPSLLESTSLIFAFGHDVFSTQIAPSGAFDILGKGFNRIQLLLTVVALFVGVLVLRPMTRSKTVQGRWTAQ